MQNIKIINQQTNRNKQQLKTSYFLELTKYRGGCVICIDYSPYAKESYFRLMRNFSPIMTAITDKIKDLATQGFQPDKNGYIFGHSFGGQLASAIGRQFYEAQFKNIDSKYICFLC